MTLSEVERTKEKSDNLWPVFLKLEHFNVLLVGGGRIGLEILTAVLANSPRTRVRLVARAVSPEMRVFAADFPHVDILEKPFSRDDLAGQNLVIAATGDPHLNRQIKALASARGLLVHVAGTPELSDFHLPSAVRKGGLKIAGTLTVQSDEIERINGRRWRNIARVAVTAFGLLLVANILFVSGLYHEVPGDFWTFLAVGFVAQMVDGLLGMGYGTTAAIGLITFNVPAVAMSSSIHTAEMFASGASGYSHYRFGNVKKDLFRSLLIPGVLGAVGGALLLVWLDGKGSLYVKPVLAVYTLALGLRILWRVFFSKTTTSEVKSVHLLAGAGGFLDSFGGGGWGPLVTGTLITKGKTPRYVIGSVSLAEFFVTLASALTFFAAVGIGHWPVILGLILGGVLAAPLAARLVGKLPTRHMLIGVGVMVVAWSVSIFVKMWAG